MNNTKQDRAAFAAILQGLIINSSVKYKAPEEEKAVFNFYFEALKHLELDEIKSAAKVILAKWKWNRLPTVAEILYSSPRYALPADNAEIQACDVIEFLNKHGAAQEPDFKDPITKHLMSTRWPYYNWAVTILDKDIKWWIKEFKEAYIAYSDRDLKYLLGFDQQKQIEK